MTEIVKFGTLEVEVHPAALLFPPLSDEEFAKLVADIRVNGLATGIVLWTPDHKPYGEPPVENYLLDGVHRLRAIEAAFADDPKHRDSALKVALQGGSMILGPSIAGPTQLYSRVDPYARALSLNRYRRQLSVAAKREVIARVIEANPDKSNRQIGGIANVDHKTIGSLRAEMEDVGRIPHVDTRTDTKGRRQPAHKPPPRPMSDNRREALTTATLAAVRVVTPQPTPAVPVRLVSPPPSPPPEPVWLTEAGDPQEKAAASEENAAA